ncbi:MAG: antirestriction protein [Burkholderia sp.]
MNTTATSASITAALVPDDQRLDFLPAFFGPDLMMYGEALVYKWMGRLSHHYKGGFWLFHSLSNGGYYMAPNQPVRLRVAVAGNGFDAFVSADAAGVIATLFALGQLAATENGAHERFCDLYHALRDYAGGHAEAAFIDRAID